MEKTGTKPAYDPLVEFMRHYAGTGAPAAAAPVDASLPVEERLRRRIVDGNPAGLTDDLDSALSSREALQIINEILLPAMKTVGDLFGAGEMQLPFVLQSAETMKTAVSYLEGFMDRASGANKGVIVLATVKGDVHDIGKNLVDIILTNNGYKVINLGIKVSAETMLDAAAEHNADAIGMSGLLVKSTLVMKENLAVIEHRGIRIPIVLGGAALTRRFVEQELRPLYPGKLAYANDAFDGLAFMESLKPGAARENATGNETAFRKSGSPRPGDKPTPPVSDNAAEPSGMEAKILADADVAESGSAGSATGSAPVPRPPFLGSRIVADIPLKKVYEYINETALIRGQWQVRRGKLGEEAYSALVEKEIRPVFEEIKTRAEELGILKPAVVCGYFPCYAENDDLVVCRPGGLSDEALIGEWPRPVYSRNELVEWMRFRFPRQGGDRRLCIADFFRPSGSDEIDVCAFHVVTMGAAVSEHASGLFASNRYQDYLYMHGLGVECAEALAEYWHKRIREELGIASKDAGEIRRLFSQGYQGSRYSFGYPACPNLEDQRLLFNLLRPERIGVTLTEEFQLVPEQSTSAIIVHHPEARYFNIRE